MAYEDISALLGGWEGFELVDVTRVPAGGTGPPRIELTLRALAAAAKRCSGCGEVVAELHDVAPRRVRDLPILDADTWLILPRARVRCPRCGPTVEHVAWLDRYQRMTTRFADSIARLAQVLPLEHVAQQLRVGWQTVKQIDRRALARRLGPADLRGVRQIAIDEFALHRGRRYATVIVEVVTKRVLWVSRDRDRAALEPFFTALGAVACAQVEAVVMDMWRPYREAVRAHCPQAAIVYDLFHVLARYGQEVVDRVRVDETNRLHGVVPHQHPGQHQAEAIRRVIKGTRWLLLKDRRHLRRPERVRLRELLAANRALFIVYVLKDDLKQLWRFRYPGAARRFWRSWYRRARASRLAPLMSFARRLRAWSEYIINHCRYPLHTGLLEGINNKIKVLKRMAYGYRDEAYFFLKIRAAFPGIPR
jgi:transposase